MERQSCFLSLSRGALGSWLRVAGDKNWVPGALRSISYEVDRGRPWWGFIRHPVIAVGLTILILAPAFMAGIRSIYWLDSKTGTPDIVIIAATALLTLVSFAGLFLVPMIGNRLLPAFEVLEPGRVTTRQKIARSAGIFVGAFLGLVSILQGVAWLFEHV